MIARNEIAVTETYHDVEPLIWHFIYQFTHKFGGDPDEYFSLAQEVFVKVYNGFDPTRGSSFGGYLLPALYRKFRANLNMERRRQPVWQHHIGDRIVESPEPQFDDRALLAELSQDACDLVGMILEAPDDVSDALHAVRDSLRAIDWRAALKSYLTSQGWSSTRIARTFEEVAEAL